MAERQYSEIETMEGRPVFDGFLELVEKNGLHKASGFTAPEVALYLQAQLHPLYQIRKNKEA